MKRYIFWMALFSSLNAFAAQDWSWANPQAIQATRFDLVSTGNTRINANGSVTLYRVSDGPVHYQLARKFKGTNPITCLGVITNSRGQTDIALCILSEMGVDSCAEVDANQCMEDPSILPFQRTGFLLDQIPLSSPSGKHAEPAYVSNSNSKTLPPKTPVAGSMKHQMNSVVGGVDL